MTNEVVLAHSSTLFENHDQVKSSHIFHKPNLGSHVHHIQAFECLASDKRKQILILKLKFSNPCVRSILHQESCICVGLFDAHARLRLFIPCNL